MVIVNRSTLQVKTLIDVTSGLVKQMLALSCFTVISATVLSTECNEALTLFLPLVPIDARELWLKSMPLFKLVIFLCTISYQIKSLYLSTVSNTAYSS